MKILTYRLSVFGDLKRFVPTTSLTIDLTQLLRTEGYELLPTIINQPSVQGIPPAAMQIMGQFVPGENRLQFVSPQGELSIRILAERLDVELIQTDSDDLEELLSEKLVELLKLLKLMLGALNEPQGTRLAYYVDLMIPEKGPDDYAPFYAQNNLGLAVPDGEGCVEWNHRSNQRTRIRVEDADEACNCILLMESANLQVLNQVSGEQQSISGLHVISDINTLAECNQPRFTARSLEPFSEQAQGIFFGLFRQINDKLRKRS